MEVEASIRKRTSIAVVSTQTSPTMKQGQSSVGLGVGKAVGATVGSLANGVRVGNFVGLSVHSQKSKMRPGISKNSPEVEAYAQSVRFSGLSPGVGRRFCMIVPSGCWKISKLKFDLNKAEM